MSAEMSSAHVLVLVLVAVVHVTAQADSVKTTPATKEEVAIDAGTGSSDHNTPSHDQNVGKAADLNELLARYFEIWDSYNAEKNTRAPRTKRWAELYKRPGYYRYSPSQTYRRFRYPSNLMALLRGSKRGWSDEPRVQRWQYPSNLMALLRGKKSVPDEEVTIDEDNDGIEKDEDEMSPLEKEAFENVMKRAVEGWHAFLDDPEESVKRSALNGYGDNTRNSLSRQPFGSRQFMVWNGGRYILG